MHQTEGSEMNQEQHPSNKQSTNSQKELLIYLHYMANTTATDNTSLTKFVCIGLEIGSQS